MVIDGLILAGGRSRRFGADKRVEPVEGRSMAELAYSKLAAVVDGTIFVATGARRETLPGLERAVAIVDEAPGRGPLGGLSAALLRSRDGVLVIACDLPNLRRSTLERLARAARSGDRPVALRGPQGWEPLVAWYPRSALHTVRLALRSSRPAPFLVLERLGALALPVVDASEVINVNTRSDLAVANAIRGREPGA
jgi:molybdopterin-guanine dinucleotide biosynthesis protein A